MASDDVPIWEQRLRAAWTASVNEQTVTVKRPDFGCLLETLDNIDKMVREECPRYSVKVHDGQPLDERLRELLRTLDEITGSQ